MGRCVWIYRGILLAASLLVPRAERSDWLKEWQSELYYLLESRDRTWRVIRFCFGSFRDAFWFWHNSPASNGSRTLWLRSPVRCLAILACLAIITCFSAALRPELSFYTNAAFLWAELGMIAMALLLLPAIMTFGAREYAGGALFPARRTRLRRGFFLAAKFALVVPIIFAGSSALRL